jgi:peptidoglycan/xylan/chitin deacetylase (PgdA/CDA1 family)
MNIQRIIDRWKRSFERLSLIMRRRKHSGIRYALPHSEKKYALLEKIKNKMQNPYILYGTFIVIGSIFCILMAQLSHGSSLRRWYYRLTHDEVINKGVQHAAGQDNENQQRGTFLTYYRFHRFNASDPTEVDSSAPMIALTFDDGPNPENTTRILDVLNANYSRATFFVVGTNAENYPETLKAISTSGSEIGNHTYSHAKLTDLGSADVEEQIDKVNRAVKKATGENTTVIRPPYGAYNEKLLKQLEEPVVLWDLDTEDWDSRNAQTIVENVLSQVEDGDIILMHDIYESTAEAVELLVPKLKERGFQIVTVSEMARYKGKELELHKAYGEIQSAAQ